MILEKLQHYALTNQCRRLFFLNIGTIIAKERVNEFCFSNRSLFPH